MRSSRVGNSIIFTGTVIDGFCIGGEIAVGREFFQDGVEGRFLDGGNGFYGLADFVAIGIMLINDGQDKALN